VLLPEANYRANMLLSDITRLKPGFAVDQGSFSNAIKGFSLMVRKVDGKTGELEDVVMYDKERPNIRTVVTAGKGRITFTPDYRNLVMTLENGQIHELSLPGMNKYRRIYFRKHRYVFEATGYGFERSDENKGKRGGRELSASELLVIGEELRSRVSALERTISSASGVAGKRAGLPGQVSGPGHSAAEEKKIADLEILTDQLDSFRESYYMTMIEYHKKYSLAFACVAFALVGAPLGVMARRGGFGVGAGLSLLFFVLYWALMIGGEKITKKGILPPVVAVWMPDILLAAIGLYMLHRLSNSITGSTR
jgi:lipopolysaccharide export system permease protein